MFNNPILARFSGFSSLFRSKRTNLHNAFLNPGALPGFVSDCPSAMRILDLIGSLPWQAFPERNLQRNWGQPTIPHAAFSAACLLKLNENMVSMGDFHLYLLEHPAFIWLLGFPLKPSRQHACGFDPQTSLPTERHLTHMLREIPNATLQFLLEASTRQLLEHFAKLGFQAGDCISLDTKHILAWVQENNPKAYVETRFDKTKQPKGDHDCKLGCKRRHNQRTSKSSQPATPISNPIPADTISVGEFYWGYGSGAVVVKVPDYGEFILAEMTQTFDHADVSYFFPLMSKTEQILGFKPRFGTFDAAFDAWYVYDYFHCADDPLAFAAVPFSEKDGYKAKGRQFSLDGLPICAAGLEMPLQFTYMDNTVSIISHERGKYVCPLRFPQLGEQTCPINHENWKKKGCTAAMPTSIGARLRYTLDRESQIYKDIYRQRTAVERINSQAYALGIERPHIRNGNAIANTNTLIYTLINLRLLQRLRQNG
jgi:hypothetical protein